MVATYQPRNATVRSLVLGLFIWLSLDHDVTSLRMEAAFSCSLPASLVSEETSIAVSACSCKMGCLVRPNCTAVSIINYQASPIACHFSFQDIGDDILVDDTSSITFLVSEDATATTQSEYVVRSCLPTKPTASTAVSVPMTSEPDKVPVELENLENISLSPALPDAFTVSSNNVGSLPSSRGETCVAPYAQIEGVGCLQFVNKLKSFQEARQRCRDSDGDLFVASDEGHFQRLREYLLRENYGQSLWVGVEYQKWLNGRGVSRLERSVNQEEFNLRSCAVTAPVAKYKLLAYQCNTRYYFLCQKPNIMT